MRYEGHRMVISYKPDEEPFHFGGFFGAAMLASFLVDTDEGDTRSIGLTTVEEQEELFARYEREVLHDDWGHLEAEAEQLNDAYLQFSIAKLNLQDIIPNLRLVDLIMRLVVQYMEHLVREVYGEHIWEYRPWNGPFSLWLYNAAFAETERQRYIKTNWTDVVAVNSLVDLRAEEQPTLFFEGEDATDIMSRYFEWLSTEYTAMKREEPGATITTADCRSLIDQETDYAELEPDLAQLNPNDQRSFRRWMKEWKTFITVQLRPQEEIHFWRQEVPEDLREKLLNYLRLQEKQPLHYKALTSAVYALRQQGYIPYKLGLRTMRQWLSENLSEDYMVKNKASQFDRAWKELGRYTDAVREQVELLEDYGIRKL